MGLPKTMGVHFLVLYSMMQLGKNKLSKKLQFSHGLLFGGCNGVAKALQFGFQYIIKELE
jgi:hypothetical protein